MGGISTVSTTVQTFLRETAIVKVAKHNSKGMMKSQPTHQDKALHSSELSQSTGEMTHHQHCDSLKHAHVHAMHMHKHTCTHNVLQYTA